MLKFTCFLSLLSFWACTKQDPKPVVVVPPVVVTPPVATDTRTFYTPKTFVMGGDLSYVNQIEDNGGVYRDSAKAKDPFRLLKDRGMNCVRVRLWHNPQWSAALNTKGKVYSGLEDVSKTIRRAKQQGMVVNLCIQYSDEWADPGKQKTPAAWANLDFATLKDSMYQYTLFVLQHLEKQGLTPEMVQIGNETNGGMLFPKGQLLNNNWQPFTDCLKMGIKAVRDFSKTATIKPQIILHVAQMQNTGWWTDGIYNKGGVTDFDILGISHYYKWSTVNAMSDIADRIKSLKSQYNKKVMIVETAFSWTTKSADNYNNFMWTDTPVEGFAISEDGQGKYMKSLVQTVISAGGSGVMYWEPAWITSSMKDLWGTGSSWENNTLFDFTGNALPSVSYMTEKYTF
jgi:arabinogalactan endo-1,4-beta-galactosidase